MPDVTRETEEIVSQIRSAVRSHIAPVSVRAASLLDEAVIRSGSLQRVVRLLGVPAVNDPTTQVQILASYMLGCGSNEFVAKLSSLAIEPAEKPAESQAPAPNERGSRTKQRLRSSDTRGRHRPSATDTGHGEERWLRARYPDAQGVQADGTAAHAPKAPSLPTDKTWPEIDRRSGLERRVRQDRRKDLVAISQNSRFGGERRSGFERRVDPPFVPTNIRQVRKNGRSW